MRRKAASASATTALFAIAVMVAATCLSVFYASPFARTWDEVDFALALQRYDLLAMQPHFPGYPYFILGGWLFHRWVNDPVQALAIFNSAMALSSAVPMALLAHRCTSGGVKSLLLPALVLTSPYLWLMAARPMSECAGMALLWWYLWSVRYAMDRPISLPRHMLALFMFGLLMGTRLSFFPFGLALLPLWMAIIEQEGGRLRRWGRLGFSAAMTVLFQLIWVAGLILSEGTLSGFWKLSFAFVAGHFSEWGGGVVSIPMPLGERLVRLLGLNLFESSLTGGSAVIGALLSLVALAPLASFAWRPLLTRGYHWSTNQKFMLWLAGCALLYALWALFGQNIEKPRHVVPVVAPLLLILYVAAVRTAEALSSERRTVQPQLRRIASGLINILLIVLISIQFVYGAQLQKQQAGEEPAVYQLHRYVSSQHEPLVLFTWEETRVLQYLGAAYDHQRIYTYGYFLAIAQAEPGRRVLLTDHVVQGFEDQGKPIRDHVKKMAEFKSALLFDPVYAEITLYEWIR
ncbi:nucleoporin-interacting protein [Paenibacillus sedimenti]|uniref:Nucleoporin-interacting protein n=1 Tax=Paenibacillus sedimenti TaxID=2770274 RepID=A0A926KSL3_9BACL|nr:nucleoporin-interacting protein [Paenibacillus sedimenti]MBD0382146.1 nucleoporin-interacting protein [Paenibacillus sedimenti]